MREQFLPDGALHVRVNLKVFVDATVMASFWVRRGHLQPPTDIDDTSTNTSISQGDSTNTEGATAVVELVGKVRVHASRHGSGRSW